MAFASIVMLFLAFDEGEDASPKDLLSTSKKTQNPIIPLALREMPTSVRQAQNMGKAKAKAKEARIEDDIGLGGGATGKRLKIISAKLFKKEARTATLVYSAKVLRRRKKGAINNLIKEVDNYWQTTRNILGLSMSFGMALFSLGVILLVVAYLIHFFMELAPTPSLVLSLVVTPLSALLFVASSRKKYADKFRTAMVEFLDGMGRALASGFTVVDSVKMLSDDTPEPLKSELDQVLNQMRLGVPMEEAFEQVAKRVQLVEFWFFAIAVEIQAKSGGSLSRVIERLGQATRSRIESGLLLKQQTSNARSSGWVLGFAPLVLGAFLNLISPGYYEPMLASEMGQSLVYVSGGLYLCAIVSIMWLLRDKF